jgi:hypothetical protein
MMKTIKKKLFTFCEFFNSLLLIFFTAALLNSPIFSQVLTNNGAFIKSQPGSFIRVNGSVENNNSGIITVNGDGTALSAQVYVTEDITNNATITADGYIKLLRHWYNNNTFNYGLSTVFMEGGNQFLSGTVATTFNNLTLDGTGVKTQQINKSAVGILDVKNLELNTDIFGFFMLNPSATAIIRTSGSLTGGFVSSANGGFLSRATNATNSYLFPVGSTANNSANTPGSGTTRYRPVDVTPSTTAATSYTVRMANVDATTETFDRTLIAPTICATNPLFYHQINRSAGTANADVTVNFIVASDGVWQGLARWNITTPNLWEEIAGSTITAGTPFSQATKTSWNNFSATPYILYNVKPTVTVTCADICSGSTTAVTANPTPSGTYTYTWTVPGAFSPNPGSINTFNSGIGGTYSVVITDPVTNCASDPIDCTFVVTQNPSINALSPP